MIRLIAGGDETVYGAGVASGDLLRGEELQPSHIHDKGDDVRFRRPPLRLPVD